MSARADADADARADAGTGTGTGADADADARADAGADADPRPRPRSRWRHALLASALGATLALALPPSPGAAQGATLRGTIDAVDMRDHSLAVRTDTQTQRVRVVELTLVVIAGRPGTIADLRPGQAVQVALEVTASGVVTDRAARVTVLPGALEGSGDRPKRGPGAGAVGFKHRLREARTRVMVRVPLRPGR